MEASVSVYDEIREERARQDEKWGGPEHDDAHGQNDWVCFIDDKLCEADHTDDDADYRRRLIQIAALAVAAIESLDRHTAREASR